jgi:tetratricopeptide (TPR) repeat protein
MRARDWARAADTLRRALSLWRGGALEDIRSRILREEYANPLEQERLATLGARLDADLRLGRQNELVPELSRLVEAHPLREIFHEQLMLALYRVGRQAEALEAYRRVRRLLREELGVEPGHGLSELHARILAADPSLAGADAGEKAPLVAHPPLAQLPADLPDFTGREDEARRLADLLAPDLGADRVGAVVVTAVSGTGGIGKTALAVHAAHLMRDRFPDGQIYADLGSGERRPEPADLLGRFLRDLGLDSADIPDDPQERAVRYRSLIAGRRVLILLDNARDAAQVRPLLPGGGAGRVLVTSRSRLADLEGAVPLDLGVLDDADALALFTRIVGPRRVAAELKATADVLAVCAGLPLAIRIAGARLANRPGWSVRFFADRLADHCRRLDELAVGDLAVRAALEISYEDLTGRRTPLGTSLTQSFRLLALTPTAETGVPAAAALLDLPEARAEDVLEALVDANLLQSQRIGRYRMHDLLRVYADERSAAQDSEESRAEAAKRLLRWYVRTAGNAALAMNPRRRHPELDFDAPHGEPLAFDGYDCALAWLDLEHANLVAATVRAAELGLDELAWKIPILLFDLFNLRAHHADAVAAHEAGLAAARRLGDQAAEGWLLSHLSVAHSNAEHPDESIACLRAALEIDKATGNRPSEAVNLVNLGFAYFVQRKFELCVATLEAAAAVAAETGHRVAEAAALANTGEAYKELGRYEEAAAMAKRALAVHRALGDRQAEGSALASMAEIECLRGNAAEALRLAREALPINRETGFRREEASSLFALGRAHAMLGETAKARERLTEAHAVFSEVEDARAAQVWAQLAGLD